MSKKGHRVCAGLLLAVLVGVGVWCLVARTLAQRERMEVYDMYKDMPGVRVGHINDYKINDTVRLDLTTFEAMDDEGWKRVKKQFNLIQAPTSGMTDSAQGQVSNAAIELPTISLLILPPRESSKKARRGKPAETQVVDVGVWSEKGRWLVVYEGRDGEQMKSVVQYFLKRLSMNEWNDIPIQETKQ